MQQETIHNLKFYPIKWNDTQRLQSIFNGYSGFDAINLQEYTKPSGSHFAMVGSLNGRVIGLITAKTKTGKDCKTLEIKPPLLLGSLITDAERELCEGSAYSSLLTAKIILADEFKLAIINRATTIDPDLMYYQYGPYTAQIYRTIETPQGPDPLPTGESTPRESAPYP